jgi:glucose/arabinose dehydrogenase
MPGQSLLLLALVSLMLLAPGERLSANAQTQVGEDSFYYLPLTPNHFGLPPADEASQRISLPPGFAIRIYAQGLSGPRLMAIGPGGYLYVAERGANRVVRLPDRDRDGLADGVEIVVENLTSPHNIEWRGGWLYVAEIGKIERFRDGGGDPKLLEVRELVTSNIPGAGGHNSRTLHFGPDGKLYISAGSTCNVCVESDPRRAAILRFNPDGTIPADNPFAQDSDIRKRAVWAYGLRNSVDFLWSPAGALWADHNGSDLLGDNLPPEELIIPVQKGMSHGWPYCYTPVLGLNLPAQGEVRDDRLALPAGFTCAQAAPAMLTIPAHSAPLGMSRASRTTFPAHYQDDVFVAIHGSWNTNSVENIRDCKVERVVITNGSVAGSETFASGWRAPGMKCGDGETWGRPAGVIDGPDGSLFISDDKGGRIYRVVYVGE